MRRENLLAELQFSGIEEISEKLSPDTPTLFNSRNQSRREARAKLATMPNRGSYQNRRFISLDGESVNHGLDHHAYVLLAASTGDFTTGYDMGTKQCFDFLLNVSTKNVGAIFVAYAFNYDVNMMLKDVPLRTLERLKSGKWVQWSRYKFRFIPNKQFFLSRIDTGVSILVNDSFTFFACSFVDACTQYLGEHPALVKVREGKQARNVFEYSELETFIYPYCKLELELMVLLMEALRDALAFADIHPKGWHGPGAVASALMMREKIKNYKQVSSSRVQKLAAMAYFGGRFEQFKTGIYLKPVYQYDIRSAYPYALTMLPSLKDVVWHASKTPTDNNPFKVYKVAYSNMKQDRRAPNPFPVRDEHHAIFYPQAAITYVWGPEYEVAKKWFGDKIKLLGVFEIEDSGIRPFEFVSDMYEQRAQWKRDGNPAQLAAKLGMNSIYGKLAQRVGWNVEKQTAPSFHQLEWAGFVTSLCRARMLDLIMQAPNDIIAVETDGIFSSAPLDCDIGPSLGQMEMETYKGILYVQSGLYYTMGDADGWDAAKAFRKAKTRGFTSGTLPVNEALRKSWDLSDLEISSQRFGTLGSSMGKETWRRFNDHSSVVQWGGMGKRYHKNTYCDACFECGVWHDTIARNPKTPMSHPHTLPWIEDQMMDNPYQGIKEVDYNYMQ